LDRAKIAYMVVGGQAVLLYGEPRLTRDIALTLAITPERLDEVLAVVGALALRPLVDPEEFTRTNWVLPCQDPATQIRVDFIFSDSDYERDAIRRTREMELDGYAVDFAAPEDLVVQKIVAGRPRDTADVRAIVLKNPDLDLGRIRRILSELSNTLAEPLVMRFEALLPRERGP